MNTEEIREFAYVASLLQPVMYQFGISSGADVGGAFWYSSCCIFAYERGTTPEWDFIEHHLDNEASHAEAD